MDTAGAATSKRKRTPDAEGADSGTERPNKTARPPTPEDAEQAAKQRFEDAVRPPDVCRELPVAHVRSGWRGLRSLQTVVIFGDSYSAPTLREAEEEEDDERASMTWVDHLRHHPGMSNATIHNYAFSGATVEHDLAFELGQFFAEFPKKTSPTSVPALAPESTTYVIYLGINDCGQTEEDELEPLMETLMDAAHDLYVKAGARNFIFIDVPPMGRFPGALSMSYTLEQRVNVWNALLLSEAKKFAEETSSATVFVLSSHVVFSDILDDPEHYGFTEDDVNEEGSGIWVDELHASSHVHKIMADVLLKRIVPDID
ncbi:hypothetical protein OH77DRAFT_1442517 [Trametes cingulata]|nr:hypothetical protein OH77DRAFT_1442517 [Trametes cingulata]